MMAFLDSSIIMTTSNGETLVSLGINDRQSTLGRSVFYIMSQYYRTVLALTCPQIFIIVFIVSIHGTASLDLFRFRALSYHINNISLEMGGRFRILVKCHCFFADFHVKLRNIISEYHINHSLFRQKNTANERDEVSHLYWKQNK